MSRRVVSGLFALGWSVLLASAARADLTPVATYQFQNTLAADQGGVAALTAVDPTGTSGFQTATLYGQTRQVYQFSGNASPASDQGGLTLGTSGLVASNQYSVEMVFQFVDNSGWRRILDVQNRQSDNGFYVDPSSHLDVFPVVGGTTNFTANAFHDVVLTVANDGTVNGYLDGNLEFSTTTAVMNVDSNNLMGFFLDNVVSGGQGEYSPGQVGLIQLYNDVLSPAQIAAQAVNPFAGLGTVPEPSSVALLGLGAAGFVGLAAGRRRRHATAGRG